ncbi:unnamed protein product, partial [Ilex paraguariensis]
MQRFKHSVPSIGPEPVDRAFASKKLKNTFSSLRNTWGIFAWSYTELPGLGIETAL